MLILFSLILSASSVPVREPQEQKDIPTFTGVDWDKAGKGCFDTDTKNFVPLEHQFSIDCSICTCERNGFWCVPKCSQVYEDFSLCIELYTHEDECCPRTECLKYADLPNPETIPYGGLPTETTEDWWSTETEVIMTNEEITSSPATESSTSWANPPIPTQMPSDDDAWEYSQTPEYSDVWTTYTEPVSGSYETPNSDPSSWYAASDTYTYTTESYLEWLYREIHWEETREDEEDEFNFW